MFLGIRLHPKPSNPRDSDSVTLADTQGGQFKPW